MTPEEKDFFKLLAVLASEGLFNGRDRDGVVERITGAFEAAIEAVKREKPAASRRRRPANVERMQETAARFSGALKRLADK